MTLLLFLKCISQNAKYMHQQQIQKNYFIQGILQNLRRLLYRHIFRAQISVAHVPTYVLTIEVKEEETFDASTTG
jgi:hypothetical protein